MNLTCLYVKKRIIIYWHIFHSSGFHHICNIKCRLDCRYSPQNISNAKNFNPHKKPISLLNVPICTQGMQRTWWPEAGTIIVTGPYWSPYSWLHNLQNGIQLETIPTSNTANGDFKHDYPSMYITVLLAVHVFYCDVTGDPCGGAMCECDHYLKFVFFMRQ